MTEIRDFDKYDTNVKVALLHTRSIDHAKRLDSVEQMNKRVVSTLNQIKYMVAGGCFVLLADKVGILAIIKSVLM